MVKANVATRTAAPESTSRLPQPTSAVAVEEGGASKKRKREDLDQSDPKLQEYLQVMRSGRESLVANETAVESSGTLAREGGALLPDGESDDEYVEVPSRREKLRKVDHAMRETTVAPVQEPTTTRKGDATVDGDGVAGALAGSSPPISSTADQPAAAAMDATDDDWLRSRTNRLLDLVDPDDISHVAAVQNPTTETTAVPEVGNDNKAPHSEHAATQDGQGELPPQGQDMGSPTDVILRTSRLFIRNLAYTASEDDLREAFEKFGGVDEVSCLLFVSLPLIFFSSRLA